MKTSMPNPVGSLGYIKCYNSRSPRSIKRTGNSVRYNCQKICSWPRRPKTILETRKKAAFLYVISDTIIYKFFKDFTNHIKQFLAVNLSPRFLNTGIINKTFQESGKQGSFRYILKSSASIYESLGSQFFRTTTGILSGPDVFD